MSAKKKTTKRKAASKKPAKPFEETLWDTANKLRGSVESFFKDQHPGPATAGSTNTRGEGEIRQKLVDCSSVKLAA